MKDFEAEIAEFEALWSDLDAANDFPARRPLLAHYTSIATLECIMKGDELWLSNPLFMNDWEELRFGITEAARAFHSHAGIHAACRSTDRYDALQEAFGAKLDQISNEHSFDTYVLCFSEHRPEQTDGMLSMWRGYGGNGNGAAIVFDTKKINAIPDSPLILSRVHYASRAKRLEWIEGKLDQFAQILSQTNIPPEQFYRPVHSLLERFKLFALFTKHHGFEEEREWRLVYLKDRDPNARLDPMLHYALGPRGIEPKLKFKIGPVEGITDAMSLEEIVDQIILGPSISSNLAVASVKRMLDKLDKGSLANKLVASSTPFRSSP